MRLSVTLLSLFSVAAVIGAHGGEAVAQGKPWPERPVRIFVPSAAGGAAW